MFPDPSYANRRQIYLILLPVGACLVSAFVLINRHNLPQASLWVAFGISVLLLIGSGIIFWQPQRLVTIEAFFYFFMVLFFPIFSGLNLNNATAIAHSTPEYFSEVINGMTMWEAIFFIGAFLTVSQKMFKLLVNLVFVLVFAIAIGNLLGLYLSGRWELVYLFHWVHSLFALTVTILLILRIGRLQQYYATTDQVTGLHNRHEALNLLKFEYERASRYQTSFSVILLDIDHFKRVNDSFGHPIGDQVLREFAQTIEKSLRKTDYVMRWGGEEFLIILPNMDLVSARLTAERIRGIIVCSLYPKIEHLTASFGVATYQPGQTLDDLLACVDQALYQAKHEGRNRVIVFESGSVAKDGV
jgi:diguanylate cyclase (GGDEF)-like protein